MSDNYMWQIYIFDPSLPQPQMLGVGHKIYILEL